MQEAPATSGPWTGLSTGLEEVLRRVQGCAAASRRISPAYYLRPNIRMAFVTRLSGYARDSFIASAAFGPMKSSAILSQRVDIRFKGELMYSGPHSLYTVS